MKSQIIFTKNKNLITKIADISQRLEAEKKSLGEIVKTETQSADYKERVNNLTVMIVDLRNLINNAKANLQGSLFDFYK